MVAVEGKTRLTKQEGDGGQGNREPDRQRSRENLLQTAAAAPKMFLLCFGFPVLPFRPWS